MRAVYSSRGDFDHVKGDVRQLAIVHNKAVFLLVVRVESVDFVSTSTSTSSSFLLTGDSTSEHHSWSGAPCLVRSGSNSRFLTREEKQYCAPTSYYYVGAMGKDEFSIRKAETATCTVLTCSPILEYESGKIISVPYTCLRHFEEEPRESRKFDPVPTLIGRHIRLRDYDRRYIWAYGTIVGIKPEDVTDYNMWIVRLECVIGDYAERRELEPACDEYDTVPRSTDKCWTPPEGRLEGNVKYVHVPIGTKQLTKLKYLYRPTLDEFSGAFMAAVYKQLKFLRTHTRATVVKVGVKEDSYVTWVWAHVVTATKHRFHVTSKQQVNSDLCRLEHYITPTVGDIVYINTIDARSGGRFRDNKPKLPNINDGMIYCKDYEDGFELLCRFIFNRGYNSAPRWELGVSRLHDIMLYFWDPENEKNVEGSRFRRTFMKI